MSLQIQIDPIQVNNSPILSLLPNSTTDQITSLSDTPHTSATLSQVFRILKPGGKFIFFEPNGQGQDIRTKYQLRTALLMTGFSNVSVEGDRYTAIKPAFEVKPRPLKIKKKKKSKANGKPTTGSHSPYSPNSAPNSNSVGNTSETHQSIHPQSSILDAWDSIMDEPNEASTQNPTVSESLLSQCKDPSFTTGENLEKSRKTACANCTCGLADSLADKPKQTVTLDTQEDSALTQKSSCGSVIYISLSQYFSVILVMHFAVLVVCIEAYQHLNLVKKSKLQSQTYLPFNFLCMYVFSLLASIFIPPKCVIHNVLQHRPFLVSFPNSLC